MFSSVISTFSTALLGLRGRLPGESFNKEPFLISKQVKDQGERDISQLGRLLPANVFPLMEIENIGLCLSHNHFDLTTYRKILSEKCAALDLNKIADEINRNLSQLPGTDFAKRVEELANNFSTIHKAKNESILNRNLNNCYRQASELKEELQKFYFSSLEDPKCQNKTKIAERIADVIPAEEMSLANVKRLLQFTAAPLKARFGGVFNSVMPVNYDLELIKVMLTAQKFDPLSRRYPELVPEKSIREVAMITGKDTYTKEALEFLIYDESKQVRTEVLAAIIVRNPKLINDHKLIDLFVAKLPFSKEQNLALIESALKEKSVYNNNMDNNTYAIFSGNDLMTTTENVKSLFRLQDDDKARQIALLAKLFKYESK